MRNKPKHLSKVDIIYMTLNNRLHQYGLQLHYKSYVGLKDMRRFSNSIDDVLESAKKASGHTNEAIKYCLLLLMNQWLTLNLISTHYEDYPFTDKIEVELFKS